MAHGICEVLWVKRILEDYKLFAQEGVRLHCNNKSATAIATHLAKHDSTKHKILRPNSAYLYQRTVRPAQKLVSKLGMIDANNQLAGSCFFFFFFFFFFFLKIHFFL